MKVDFSALDLREGGLLVATVPSPMEDDDRQLLQKYLDRSVAHVPGAKSIVLEGPVTLRVLNMEPRSFAPAEEP